MIFSILLALFLVIGSISASEDISDSVSLEDSEAIVNEVDAGSSSKNILLESSNEDISEEENSNNVQMSEFSSSSSSEDLSVSLNGSSDGQALSDSLDDSEMDENSSGSKNFTDNTVSQTKTYDSSTIVYHPLKAEYTVGYVTYKVKVYNTFNYMGEKYREPLYGSKIKLRVYTGTKYKTYSGIINNNGIAAINIPKLGLGTHKVEIYLDNKKRATSSIKIVKSNTTVLAPSTTVKHKKNSYFKVRVLDSSGNPAKNIYLKVKVFTGKKSKTYLIKTNKNGLAKLKTSKLALGIHKVVIKTGNKKYNVNKNSKIIVKENVTAKAQKIKASAPSKTVKYKQSTYFNITVLNAYNYPVKKLALKVKVFTGKKSKTYTIKTNNKGIAKLQTKTFALGTHKITIKTSNKNYKLSKSSKIKVNKTLVTNQIDPVNLYSLQYYENDGGYHAKLTWYSKKGSEYLVLRKSNGVYEILSKVKADSEKMTYNEKVSNNTFYTYSVREIINSKSVKVAGPYDKEGLKLIDRPKVTADFQNLKTVVKWNKITGATKYRIFRKIGREGTYECIGVADGTKTSYTDYYYKSAKELSEIITASAFVDPSFNSLFYTVRACTNKKVNGAEKVSYGLYYRDGDFHLEAPSIVSLKDNKIKWGKVPNADGYIILKRNSTSDEWEEIGQAAQRNSTSISMALDEIDKNAYYAVKAFATKNGEIAYSKYDEGFSLMNYSDENSKYRILYFGDSITYGSPYKSNSSRHIFSIPNRVGELLGCTFYNPSIPGSTYHDLGQKDGKNIENGNYYRYRICREVVDQIAEGQLPGNWEDLDTASNSEGINNTSIYDYNIVVLAAGTNDYLDNSILGSEDSLDTKTFNGAFNHIMEQITNASLKRIEDGKEAIKVVFVDLYYSDRCTDYTVRQNRDTTPNKIGLTLIDYQNALLAQYNKWESQTEGVLSFYNFKTRDYDIVNQENCPYTASDNLHFTKFTYGQYGNAFAQFLVENVFDSEG